MLVRTKKNPKRTTTAMTKTTKSIGNFVEDTRTPYEHSLINSIIEQSRFTLTPCREFGPAITWSSNITGFLCMEIELSRIYH